MNRPKRHNVMISLERKEGSLAFTSFRWGTIVLRIKKNETKKKEKNTTVNHDPPFAGLLSLNLETSLLMHFFQKANVGN